MRHRTSLEEYELAHAGRIVCSCWPTFEVRRVEGWAEPDGSLRFELEGDDVTMVVTLTEAPTGLVIRRPSAWLAAFAHLSLWIWSTAWALQVLQDRQR